MATRIDGGTRPPSRCRYQVAQLRSARGARVVPSVVVESIGARFEPERMAGDVGMPGSAAAAFGAVLCAPGRTVVALESIGCAVAAPPVVVVAAGVPERSAPGVVPAEPRDVPAGVVVSAAPEGLVIDDAGVPDRSAGWPGGSDCASGVALGVPVGGTGVCAGCVLPPEVVPGCATGVPERSAGWPGVAVWAAGVVPLGVAVVCASA